MRSKEARYTIHGIYIYETFDRLCNRFHLRPSSWLPRLPKPEGVYRKVIRYEKDTRTEEYSDFWWSGYDFLFHLVNEKKHPRLYAVVGQLYETAVGVYDWVDMSKMIRHGDPGFPDTSGGLTIPKRHTTDDA